MTRSANEVQTLIAKAARGAGAPAAQAAVFGQAAVCHLTAGRAEQDLSAAFDALPGGPVLDLHLAFARLVEQAGTGAATADIPCAQAPDLVLSYAAALPFETTATRTATGASVTLNTRRPAARPPVMRLELSADFAASLLEALDKTLVPDTAASRLGGAGAGLTDND